MEGWMDGSMDGWMGRLVDGWMGGWVVDGQDVQAPSAPSHTDGAGLAVLSLADVRGGALAQ